MESNASYVNKNPKAKRILAVASAGGHWTQLMMLSEAFGNNQIIYLTTALHNNSSSDVLEKSIQIVPDADLRSSIFRIFYLAMTVAWKVLVIRPDVVISTGAASGFFSIFFAKLIGAKTIWVDSLANYQQLSRSGKYAKPFCNVFLTQWRNMSEKEKVSYWGSLL